MTYSFLEHTADVRMNVESSSFVSLLQEALFGMLSLLHPAGEKEHVERHIVVEASDRAALLVDFLNEALSFAHAGKETYTSVKFDMLSDRRLKATLRGYRASSFGEDIKAVTYHEAAVERDAEDIWRAHVVFDI